MISFLVNLAFTVKLKFFGDRQHENQIKNCQSQGIKFSLVEQKSQKLGFHKRGLEFRLNF